MSRALAPALAIVVLALLLTTPHGGTQVQNPTEVKIRWVTYINPTDSNVIASGVCVFGDYIAVVGWVSELPLYVSRPYVALLRKSDGVVVREWTGSKYGKFYNCISVSGKLYAVGYTVYYDDSYGVIFVFNENLNVLARIRSESPLQYYYFLLAYDGKALYLGGWIIEDVDGDGIREEVWLIEKRALDARLSLVSSKKIYSGSWKRGWILDMGVEPSTGRIWAVGFYEDSNYKDHSLIAILDGDLRELKVIGYPEGSGGYLGMLTGIAFDGRYVYISGDYGVAKFSVDGELVAINRGFKARSKTVYGYNYLYIFGVDSIGDYEGPMLDIHDTDLNLVKSYALGENVSAHSYFYFGRPALEGNNIYVAGYDYALGRESTRVIVVSLSLEGVTVTAVTDTEGATATATTTIATAPTAITVSDTALTQLIVAGLASIGVVLAIALLLLRRR